MIKEVKVQKEVVEHHKFCDKCGREIKTGLGCTAAKCMYCKKDLCEKCIAHEDSSPSTYRIVYCKNCWDIGKQYRPAIEELSSKIGDLYKEWRDKCKI